MSHAPPDPPVPPTAKPGSFEAFAASLDLLSDLELAVVYRERSDLVADLENRLGINRPRAQLAGRKLAQRLWVSDPFYGCGLFDGVFYRAHKDRTGVHRESRANRRWRPPGGSDG